MAWTYTNDPTNVQLDAVRLLIGDVDGDDPQLTDEELNYFVAVEGNTISAAIAAARALMSLFARKVDKAVGDLKVSYSQRHGHYKDLVTRLETRQGTKDIQVYAGGISASDKRTTEEDSDRVKPAFSRDQHRHPGVETLDPLTRDQDV